MPPRRFAALVFAGWLLVSMLVGNLLPSIAGSSGEAQRLMLGVSVVGCAMSAGVVFTRWRRVTQWFLPPTVPAATAGIPEFR